MLLTSDGWLEKGPGVPSDPVILWLYVQMVKICMAWRPGLAIVHILSLLDICAQEDPHLFNSCNVAEMLLLFQLGPGAGIKAVRLAAQI